ncbi:MAG: glycosyl transferase, partial [Pseudomonadota bacterium]
TDAARDAWFVGFTADYVAGVWMGYDDNRPLSGVTGGGLPADIWREAMVRIHEGVPVSPLRMSRGPTGQQVAERQQRTPRQRNNRRNAGPAAGGNGTPERILRGLLDALRGN